MPQGPGTYGKKRGRPRLKMKAKKNTNIYERTSKLIEQMDHFVTMKKGGPQKFVKSFKTWKPKQPTQSQQDLTTIKQATWAAKHGGKVATAAKVLDVGADVASVATGGLAALGKRLAKKAVIEPAITAGKKYYQKKVAGAVGRTVAGIKKMMGMGGGTDTASKSKKAKSGARLTAPSGGVKSTPVAPAVGSGGSGDEDKSVISGAAGKR